ncbi:MAG: hypothetical protein H6511_08195 [Holophagales bacterium]|nr:hypothetical protein [Holophagales bacterium]
MLPRAESLRVALATLLLLAAAVAPLHAADVGASLARERHDLVLDAGELAGPGGTVLREAAADARFVLLGEDHGIAEIPAFAAALYRLLEPAGFDTLAIETGPRVASEIERILGMEERRARYEAFLSEYPFSVAFYDLEPELEFLERAAALSGTQFRLIGVDQELAGASKLLLRQARALARGPEVAERLDALLEAEARAYAKAQRSGRPADLFMTSGDRGEIEAVRDLLASESPAAARPLDALLASREIYVLNAREGWRSNVLRSELMRKNLRTALPGAWPKMVVKVGAYHAYKGINPLRNRELGNFLAEVAELSGSRSLHLLVVAGEGEQTRFAGVGRPPEAAPIEVASPEGGLPALAPFLEIAARHERWSLFDLRPLRPLYRKLEPADPELERIVYGFDLVLVIPHGTASRALGVPIVE